MAVGRVLRDRTAGVFLAAVVVSGFGSSAMRLAAGIWVKSLTGSDALAALALFAVWLPVLLGPLLGAVADRLPRKPLLVGTNVVLAALTATLAAVGAEGRVRLLFAVLVLYGCVSVLMDSAESAVVAGAVPAELLGDFNGLRMTANESMKLVAPLTGAGLYARFGGGAVALLDAVSFALAAGLYALLRVRRTARPAWDGVAGRPGCGSCGGRRCSAPWSSPPRPRCCAPGSTGRRCTPSWTVSSAAPPRTRVCCRSPRGSGPSRSGCARAR